MARDVATFNPAVVAQRRLQDQVGPARHGVSSLAEPALVQPQLAKIDNTRVPRPEVFDVGTLVRLASLLHRRGQPGGNLRGAQATLRNGQVERRQVPARDVIGDTVGERRTRSATIFMACSKPV